MELGQVNELGFKVDLAPEEALKFFRAKGLKTGFAWQDVWQQEHEAAFTVAKMMDLDLLSDVRDQVDAAIAQGWTLAKFKQELQPLLEARGWWGRSEMTDPLTGETREVQLGSARRLRTIFRVNMQMAYAAGDWTQTVDNAASAPYLMYDAIDDNRTRPQHRAWDGTVLRYDDPWWNTHRPPNGFNCRCSVIQLSAAEVKARGLDIAQEAPPSHMRQYVNPRSGEISEIPDGIDPGFAYNPGKDRLPELRKAYAEKLQEFRK
jgi:SPP1 gp7 family putative phage head morphogenesis protein